MKPVKCEFTEKNLTGNAGLKHVGKFIDKLNLHQMLANHIRILRGDNAEYQAADAVLMLIPGVFAGIRHMSNMALLRGDEVIRSVFGWLNFPDDSTLGRIFKLFTHASCNELSEAEDQCRRKVWKKRWFGRVTLDFDSGVKGVFGSQEGAMKGYNPKKHGQKGYHPTFCFIAETCECLHNRFRTGNAYSANGIVHFAQECFARLPKGIWKVYVRGDSAFFSGEFLDYPENKSSLYLIKVKMKNLDTLPERQKWRKINKKEGFESAEFEYKCPGWSKPGRFAAVRKLVEVITEGVLFPEYRYDCFCYVTNENLTPWQTRKKYGKRAAGENWIGWCKNRMAAGTILTQDFWANSAIFQTCILACSLMVWMMWLKEGRRLRYEPNTIRFRFIQVPGRLLTSGRQLVLKLSKNWCFKDYRIELENCIDQLVFN